MQEVFQQAFEFGFEVRTTKVDGKTAWNQFKTCVPLVNVKPQSPGFGIYSDGKLVLCGETFDINKIPDHFLVQLWRLPQKPVVGAEELIQIGFNAGQLFAALEENYFSSGIIRLCRESGLDKLSTYI